MALTLAAVPNCRNSGPLVLTLFTSAVPACCRMPPRSFCSHMYVSVSPSASVALPVSANGVRSGIVYAGCRLHDRGVVARVGDDEALVLDRAALGGLADEPGAAGDGRAPSDGDVDGPEAGAERDLEAGVVERAGAAPAGDGRRRARRQDAACVPFVVSATVPATPPVPFVTASGSTSVPWWAPLNVSV